MKVSYHKRSDENGCVYSQAISVTWDELSELYDAINCELALGMPRKKEYIFTSGTESFLKRLAIKSSRVCFLNHTQLGFLNLFMKLDLKNRNTCLLIR